MTTKFERRCRVLKVDRKLGLVFGYAIVTKVDGQPYFDTQEDHIPDEGMLHAAFDFAKNGAIADDMHLPDSDHGKVVFMFPLTEEIAKSLDITAKRHGLLIAMAPGEEQLAKFEDGTYTGFSIGGDYGETDFVE